jgi:leucyl-tRNA synthetase
MSKSKFNVVEPMPILNSYGADVARLFVLSDTPLDKDFDWNTEALDGCWRYINRVHRIGEDALSRIEANQQEKKTDKRSDESLKRAAHQYLVKLIDTFDRLSFNKAIAFHREFTRILEEHMDVASSDALKEAFTVFVQTLTPITPHLGYELWDRFKGESFDDASLMTPDPILSKADRIAIAVQVNGKLRGTFEAEPDADQDSLQKEAFTLTTVIPFIEGKEIKKVIVVPNRIVNIVVV